MPPAAASARAALRDVDGVIGPLTRLIAERDADCSAFVIACYSDPGLFSAREVTSKPVLGIMECGVLTALTLGHHFGVIAILAGSIPRHLRALGAMGVQSRLAAELPVGLQVTELADAARTRQRLIDVGRRLVDEHGAHVLVMGCAGMAQYRQPLQDALHVTHLHQIGNQLFDNRRGGARQLVDQVSCGITCE